MQVVGVVIHLIALHLDPPVVDLFDRPLRPHPACVDYPPWQELVRGYDIVIRLSLGHFKSGLFCCAIGPLTGIDRTSELLIAGHRFSPLSDE
jgi:hypothetical protein